MPVSFIRSSCSLNVCRFLDGGRLIQKDELKTRNVLDIVHGVEVSASPCLPIHTQNEVPTRLTLPGVQLQ